MPDETSISDLPRGCLVHILGFLPLQHRLTACARVSSAWAEAAAAATASISRRHVDAACCQAVLEWASSRAPHLSSLRLAGTSATLDAAVLQLQPLPIPGLQQLHLEKVPLQLAAAAAGRPGGDANPLRALSSLTELQLVSCPLLPGLQALTALEALPGLRWLRLAIPVPVLQQSSAPAPEWTLPSSVWTHLSALTHLDLGAQHNVTCLLLQQLCGCMTQLQELLVCAANLTAPGLAPLQQLPQLNRLGLQLAARVPFSCNATPVLTQLSCLRQLEVFCWRELQPALLASLAPQLQHLELRAWMKRSTPAELSALLAALGQLTALSHLSLQDVLLPVNPEEQPLGSSAQQGELVHAACGALTASSALHTLELRHAELPAGAWTCMFPAGRQLPGLQHLVLEDVEPRLTDAEFEQLVRCCRHLTSITLLRVLQWGVSLEPLLQLPRLEELQLRHLHGDSAMRVYAQLTGLRRLHNDDANVSAEGLLRLTALTRLRHLHVHCSADPWSLPRPISIDSKAPEWLAPDVWSQLVRLVKA